MAEKIKGIITGNTDGAADDLVQKLASIVEFVKRFEEPSTAYNAIKELRPETVFINMNTDSREGLVLANNIRNTMPGVPVFLFSREKDPDIILEGLRIGVADFLLLPGNDSQIQKSVQKALGRAESGGRSADVTAVFSIKGGQGVTSIAANLTDHIHSLTKDRVILVDLNLYMGDAGIFLDLPSTYTPFDMLKDLERIDENLIFSLLNRHSRGFYLLAAPDEVSDADMVSGEDISRILGVLKKYLDHIVIDLPHDFTERSLAALDAADTILILIQQSMPVIKSVQKALKLFEELGYDEKKIKIVLNRYTEKNELTPDDISYVLNWPVFTSVANDFVSITSATNKGKTLDAARPASKINRDITVLAGLVTGIKPQLKFNKGWQDIISRFVPPLGRIFER